MIVWELECAELQKEKIPKREWPCKPWYPFGRKTYKQWKAEGKAKGVNERVVYEDVPSEDSWVTSASDKNTAEEIGNESSEWEGMM